MMRILHISDLHFGAEIPDLVSDFYDHARRAPADLIVASGDFTQTAREAEFERAAAFLSALETPVFCVPGNHDVPRFDLLTRFTDPFRPYRRFIAADTDPLLFHDDVIIAGINTARAVLPHWNWANGAVSDAQIHQTAARFAAHPARARLCVMHHPVHRTADIPMRTTVFGGHRARARLQAMRTDLVLTGHVHHAAVTVQEHEAGRTVFLSASTTLSHRLRAGGNGYNLITLDKNLMRIELLSYADRAFSAGRPFEIPL